MSDFYLFYDKNGSFYDNQDEFNSRVGVTEQEFFTLTENQNYYNMDIFIDVDGKVKNRVHLETTEEKILKLKKELAKYKEDVEQVELFGMERADYEQKKTRCAKIILELRSLEKELANINNNI